MTTTRPAQTGQQTGCSSKPHTRLDWPETASGADFDDQIRRTFAAAARGGADLGETLAIAQRIMPASFQSWYDEWHATANTAREQAEASHAAGDPVSARRGYLRASEYFRQATFFIRTDLSQPALRRAYQAHRDMFRAAMALMTHQTEVVSLDLGDVQVRGYLFSPDSTVNPRPTIIAPAGYDSTAEAGFTFVAVAALERGMNCLVFEGPGQGGVLYELGLPLRPDFEAVLTPVIDWLLTRSGVDPEALVLTGRDLAGYLAPRAAAHDHRLAALVCDPAQYDLAATVRLTFSEEDWARVMADDPSLETRLDQLVSTPHQRNRVRRRMIAHGATSIRGLLRELSRFSLADVAHHIRCPTLALSGEGDFAGTSQVHVFTQSLTVPVSSHNFSRAEGCGGRCEGLGQDRYDQVVYGWLHRRLAAHRTTGHAVRLSPAPITVWCP